VARVEAKEAAVADAKKGSPANVGKTLRITWVRSSIGYPKDQKATIKALGLRRLNQTVERPDNPQVRGQIFKVKHMVVVEGEE
jgi:large subunit ribosomal protein L30